MIHDARDRFGRYYEEFEPGDVYKHWPGRTIKQADNIERDETVLIYRRSLLGPKRDAPDAEAVRTAASAEDL